MASDSDFGNGDYSDPHFDYMDDDSEDFLEQLRELGIDKAGMESGVNWETRPRSAAGRYKPGEEPERSAIQLGREKLGPDARHATKRGSGKRERVSANSPTDESTRQLLQPAGDGRPSEGTSNGQPQPVLIPNARSRKRFVIAPTKSVRPLPRFQYAVFDAILGKCEFSTGGEFIIRFNVANPNDVDEAIKLRDAYGLSLTLAVSRKSYRPVEVKDEDESNPTST